MEKIRNFVIISHIDHGKSTLADRFLELTKTIEAKKMRPQFLDLMDLERERGITIKMQPVRMKYKEYILNLIDTPGHVDFSYEVSRSLAAAEGAILLVDATKGIQAQTLANLELAQKQKLVIIPAVNKIDLAQAQTKKVKEELAKLLNIPKDEVLTISAKHGTNVEQLLETVVKKIPPPEGEVKKPFRALIFDSKYDSFKGVIAYVRIIDGQISANKEFHLLQAKTESEVKEVGYFTPEPKATPQLKSGEVGYLATGIKESGKVRVGDTIAQIPNLDSWPGYKEPKPVVFASVYPEDPNDFDLLKEALIRLKLNDASLVFEIETKEVLGRGFRCGFLGTLHAEIVSERLKREFGLNLIVSTPSVIYKIINKEDDEVFVYSSSDWPMPAEIKEIQEPWVKIEIMTPHNYYGRVSELFKNLAGRHVETKYFSLERLLLIYEFPLREIIAGFYDKLKGVTQGFASMNYEILGYRPGDLVKLEILIAGEKEEFFSRIVNRKEAYREAKKQLSKLKEILPSQLFAVALQAQTEGRIIARETIRAKRRDVIAPLYGGDYTRKRKLLEKQKKGKRELKEKGRVIIPSKVFLEMFKT
jgi:GTP-binding protein LepA